MIMVLSSNKFVSLDILHPLSNKVITQFIRIIVRYSRGSPIILLTEHYVDERGGDIQTPQAHLSPLLI